MWDVKRKSCNHLWSYTLNAECLVCARDSLEARVADLEKQRAAAQALVEQLTEEECCACEDAIAVMRDVDLDLETPAEGLRYLIKQAAQPAPAGLSEWLISRIDAARSEAAARAFADVLEHVTGKAALARPEAGSAEIEDAKRYWVRRAETAEAKLAALASPQAGDAHAGSAQIAADLRAIVDAWERTDDETPYCLSEDEMFCIERAAKVLAAAALARPLPAQAPRTEAEIVQAGIDDYGRTSLAARVRELTPAQVLQVNQLLDGGAQEPRVELEGFAARHIAAQIDARNGNPEPLRQLIKEYSARLAEAGGLDARQ